MVGISDFGSQSIAPRNPNVPGPGAYGVRNTFGDPKYAKSGPSVSIGLRHEKGSAAVNQDVGPGRYETKGGIGDGGPKYSFSPRSDGAAADGTPRRSSSGGDEGSAKKSRKAPAAPPPALAKQYNMAENPASPRYSLGAKIQPPKANGQDNPGPGQYGLPSAFGTDKKAGVTLSPRTPANLGEREALSKPGPGNYDVERFGDRPVAPQTQCMPHAIPQPPERPGPGSYEAYHNTIEDRTALKRMRVSQEALFGARHADLSFKGRNGPGPGNYDATVGTIADTARRHNKGPTISARNVPSGELEAIYPKPGPGEYILPAGFQDRTKGISMSPRREPIVQKLQVPGPGQYEAPDIATTLKNSARGTRFNGAKEFQVEETTRAAPVSKHPGPGHYNLPSAFDTKGKGFTLGGRESKSSWATDYANTPGPGTYSKLAQQDSPRGTTFYKGQFTA